MTPIDKVLAELLAHEQDCRPQPHDPDTQGREQWALDQANLRGSAAAYRHAQQIIRRHVTESRDTARRLVELLEEVAATPHQEYTTEYMQGYLDSEIATARHYIDLVRTALADYLPVCGCGQPSIGKDVLGAPICAACQAITAQAVEEVGGGLR